MGFSVRFGHFFSLVLNLLTTFQFVNLKYELDWSAMEEIPFGLHKSNYCQIKAHASNSGKQYVPRAGLASPKMFLVQQIFLPSLVLHIKDFELVITFFGITYLGTLDLLSCFFVITWYVLHVGWVLNATHLLIFVTYSCYFCE